MPKISLNGAQIYYEEYGSGDETIVFSHGLLWSGRMFKAQVDALKDRYRVITYDHRGQGQTEVTPDGYDMDTLTDDAATLIRTLNAAPCHFVGLSMGGFVGMRLAIRQPELLRSLTLIETSADPEPQENHPKYRMLGWAGRLLGFGIVTNSVMPIMFGQTFLNDPVRADDRQFWRQQFQNNDRIGIFRALQGVINREGVYHQLGQIKTPTQVIVGDEDIATVPAKAQRIHQAIAGSEHHVIKGAGHTSSVEQPQAITRAIEAFIEKH